MTDWLLFGTLLAIVGLHWLFELLPGKRNMWCSELNLDPVRICEEQAIARQGAAPATRQGPSPCTPAGRCPAPAKGVTPLDPQVLRVV